MEDLKDIRRDDNSTDATVPMEAQVIQNAQRETSIAALKSGCTHQRLIDDVLTRGGKRTGKVRCLEWWCRNP